MTYSVGFRTGVEMSFAAASIKSELWSAGFSGRMKGRRLFLSLSVRMRVSLVFSFDLISESPSLLCLNDSRLDDRSKINPSREDQREAEITLQTSNDRVEFYLAGDLTLKTGRR